MRNWLWISALVVALDQLTKYWISTSMQLFDVIKLLPSLQFRLLHNKGVAFSLFDNAAGWQRWGLTAVSLAVSAAILVWILKLTRGERWKTVALCLILGGALGNVIDRVLLGYVVDFIEVYYGNWAWPAFNVADSAISVGAAMLVIEAVRDFPQAKKTNKQTQQ